MKSRVIYNLFLCRLGLRKVLPSTYINSRKISECGEKLVPYQDIEIRQTVAKMMQRANERLVDTPYSIEVVSGYRSLEEQMELWKMKGLDSSRVANPSSGIGGGHQTGGAVDVILLKNGVKIDVGCEVGEFTNKTATENLYITSRQLEMRKILCDIMIATGFVNHPLEWWHYCYGDRMWAAYSDKPIAIYDKL